MRLKEFIIFIIIFTIIYVLFFVVYDYIMNKKSNEKREEDVNNLININKYLKFISFYNLNSTITEETLKRIFQELKMNVNNDINMISSTYGIEYNEVLAIILFLEYIGVIRKRKILIDNNCCVPLSETDESLVLKYSILLSNKMDYTSIIQRSGLNSDRELEYLNRYYLMPGAVLNDKVISYVGDLDE